MEKEPRIVFEAAANQLEDSIELVREVLNDSRILDSKEEFKMDKLYELCLSYAYYYEKLNSAKD